MFLGFSPKQRILTAEERQIMVKTLTGNPAGKEILIRVLVSQIKTLSGADHRPILKIS